MSFFKKLSDSFTTNETRFTDARSAYLRNQFNKMDQIELSTFPDGLKSRPFSLPLKSPLHKLSLVKEINLLDVILHIVLFDLFYFGVDKNQSYVKQNNIRMFQNLKAKYPYIQIDPTEFNQIIFDSRIFFRGVRENLSSLPSSSSLFIPGLPYEKKGELDNLFKAIYLLMGFTAFIGAPVLAKFHELVNSFFIEQNSTSFKSFDDFSNASLLLDIREKNLHLNIIPADEINRIQYFLTKDSLYNENFNFSTFVDWFILVLIYNGQPIEIAEKNISDLRLKLTELSADWNEIGKIQMICSEFNNLDSSDRISFLTRELISIYGVLFQPV